MAKIIDLPPFRRLVLNHKICLCVSRFQLTTYDVILSFSGNMKREKFSLALISNLSSHFNDTWYKFIPDIFLFYPLSLHRKLRTRHTHWITTSLSFHITPKFEIMGRILKNWAFFQSEEFYRVFFINWMNANEFCWVLQWWKSNRIPFKTLWIR